MKLAFFKPFFLTVLAAGVFFVTNLPFAWANSSTSSSAEISLARHLNQIGAKIYTAYTCPHCLQQKQLFGQEAFSLINNIECHPQGENAQPQLCREAGIEGVPTWEINDQFLVGVQPLDQLAHISGYTGSQNFTGDTP